MTRFTLKFSMDNAAFDGDPAPELLRILARVSVAVADGETELPVLDVNGNVVGTWAIVVEEP